MKRRIYSAITVLCMLFALLPTAVMAETNDFPYEASTVFIGASETLDTRFGIHPVTINGNELYGCEKLMDVNYGGAQSSEKTDQGYSIMNATLRVESAESDPTCYFDINDDGTVTISYCDRTMSGNISIPATINNYPVTAIADWAFEACDNLTGINLPESITTIGQGAFYSCDNLAEINIPDSVESIGDGAFYDCISLTEINIPEGITHIGNYTFSGCKNLETLTLPESLTTIGQGAAEYCTSLTGIEIPAAVESIGGYAFFNCYSLTDVYISEGTTSIGDYAFAACMSLTDITVAEGNEYYISINGNLFTGDQTKLMQYAVGKMSTRYTVPDGVTCIGEGAFFGCPDLKTVTLPDSLESIEKGAFYGNYNISDINIPAGVTSIEELAFSICESLAQITVAEDNEHYTSVDGNLFSKDETALIAYAAGKTDAEYIIPDGVTSIANCAFYYCTGLTSIEIPGSVTTIGEDAFYGCERLTDVYYDGSESDWAKISIGDYNDCLTNATIHYMAEPMKISVSDIKGKAGDTVLVDVIVEDNTGIASLGLEFDYDAEAMTLDDVIVNEEIVATITKPEYSDIMPYHIMFDSPGNFTFNGTLLTLQFTLNEDISAGDYPVEVDFFKGRDGDYIDGVDTNFDENFEPVDITYESGVINVYTPGDINDDTRINNKDATYLLRYLAGWDIEDLAKNALDTDGSGRVNEFDATHLLRYIARWNVELK